VRADKRRLATVHQVMPPEVLIKRYLLVGGLGLGLFAVRSPSFTTRVAATSNTAPARGGDLPPAATREIEAKIQALSDNSATPSGVLQPIVITELEANSYLKAHSPEFLPQGVSDPEVHISSDHLSAAAEVNLSQLNQAGAKADDWQAKTMAWLFKDKRRVSASGKLETANGQGKLTVTRVTVGNMELPNWLGDWALETYVQPRSKTDLKKPFVLPDHVTRIELENGRATFYRSPNKGR
jgi:hypothetical protein